MNHPPTLKLVHDPIWPSEWPQGLCKECGDRFAGSETRRWCSKTCKNRAKNKRGVHARRIRKAAASLGLKHTVCETIGTFELLKAYGFRCGKCGEELPRSEVWMGHIIGVEHGGQHTRANIAPVHKACEQEWNAEQRLAAIR